MSAVLSPKTDYPDRYAVRYVESNQMSDPVPEAHPSILGVATDGHVPGGLSHWRAARFEALRAGRPAADVAFLRCGRGVQC
jgi:hypothetical protein